jgi:hypothetical protein
VNLHDIPEDDRNPEWPDPIPNESTVIATVIRNTPPTPGEEPPPLTDWQRQDLLDEIEFDLL